MNIKREGYLEHIRKFYDSNLIKVITGVRRAGKSILLEQIRDEIKEKLSKDVDHIIYINFEDINNESLHSYKKLNKHILNRIKDDDKYYIFLDEIQHVNQFEKLLSSLKATQNVSIFATGSNSKLLSGRLASLLVGRCKEFKIMPFTYQEFIEFYKINNIELPKNPFSNYLRFGGMPQRFDYDNEEDIKNYLKDIFNGIVDKDICTKKSKINKDNFLTISKYIISNVGKEFSPLNIIKYFNIQNNEEMYNEIIYRYLEKLEQACLISRVKRFDIASKRTLKKVEKHYSVDSGFVLGLSDSNQIFIARNLENIIYNELIYRGYDVRIGKTFKGEIDFVVMKDNKKCFIQVAYLLASEETIEREFSAFNSIKDPSPKYVLSLDQFDMSKDNIKHINIEEFLLNEVDLYLN